MPSVLNGIKDDLMDTGAWMRGFKAAGGGALGVQGMSLLVKKLPYIKNQSSLVQAVAQGLGSVLLGVIGERFVGESVAAGFIGGGAGHALARVANTYLPAPLKSDLAGLDDYLTPDERNFLNGGLAPESIDEVSVETDNPMLNEVNVELAGDEGDGESEDVSAATLS